MIKLAVFDWNGTLIADTNAIVEGTNKELEIYGHPPIDAKTYRDYYDIPLREFYSSLGVPNKLLDSKSLEATEAFHAYYEPRVARTRTRRGARQMLSGITGKGIASVILSNHTMEGIYLQLERLKLTHYFETVLANDDTAAAYVAGKRDRLHLHLTENNINPSHSVIIGDTVEEARIAKDLGTKVILITGGHNSARRLKQAKPDIIIDKLIELPLALEGM